MSIYVYSSVTVNYIPKARVLATTLKKHNPTYHFVLFIAEPTPHFDTSLRDCFDEVIQISDMNIPEMRQWIFKHSVVEICTAIKGFALESLLKRSDCEAVYYIDPDIAVFAPLDIPADALTRASIVLTPHLLTPETTRDAILDNELCALMHGVYNLGFLGVKNDEEGRRFAAWWANRLRDFCYADIPNGIFTDQRWIDLVPAFFARHEIIRHPGCNVATWNLSRRDVAGDFANGFTVNGQPLIFYHFSGFDSGAQLTMLEKYGSEMPATFALRDWYIATCEGFDIEGFARVPWKYSAFDNGVQIATEQRLTFRTRGDLQAAFEDPFATTSPAHSYYHWYQANGATVGRGITDVNPLRQRLLAGKAPLVYFSEHSDELITVSPSPLFDCEYYLTAYPDVAQAGIHPFLHYLHSGYKESRNPSATFDTDFYLDRYGDMLRPGENPLTHYARIGRRTGCKQNPIYDRAVDHDVIGQLGKLLSDKAPTVLMVGHFMGGGTETHIRDLAAEMDGKCNVLLLHPTYSGYVSLTMLNCDTSPEILFARVPNLEDLLDVLRTLRLDRMHVHHLWGNEGYLRELVDQLGIPFDLTLHDYYLLAPHPHICAADGVFVGDPIENAEAELLSNAVSVEGRRATSLVDWQVEHSWLLHEAQRVIAPSRDVRDRFAHVYPHLPIIVAPHIEATDPLAVPISVCPVTADEPLRVVILGALSPHKGARNVIDCAALAETTHVPVEFYVVGRFSPEFEPAGLSHLHVHGQYDPEDLSSILADIKPHLAWFPSTCPESYSYVLSEAMREGLPIVATNLGAYPERLRGRTWSWLQPWLNQPADWLSFFVSVREDIFLSGVAPQAMESVELSNTPFYVDDYLAWMSEGSIASIAPSLDQHHLVPVPGARHGT